MNTQQEIRLENLCTNYIPNRYLGDFLPAHITVRVIRGYAEYLSRLEDFEAYRHLRYLGISKKRARDFVEERTKLMGGKK